MNLGDVVTRVKEQFGDESDAQISKSTIVRWINDAQREAVLQNIGVNEKVIRVDLTAGVLDYVVPSDAFTIHRVKVRTSTQGTLEEIQWYNNHDFERLFEGWEGSTATGIPYAWTERERKIVLYPTPSMTITGGVMFEYSGQPSVIADAAVDSTSLGLPEYYHNYIVDYCLMKAYELDEDWTAFQIKAQAVQATLDFTEARENWMSQDKYPVIRDYLADSWD